MNFPSLDWRRMLFLIFSLALLTRGVLILAQQDGFYFPDSISYSRTAVKLIEHGEFGSTFGRAPGYPVFLAAVYALFGENIFAVRAVESLMGALLAVMIAVVGKRSGGELAGTLAGILWAVYPMGVFIAGLMYPTGLATFLLACAVWCMLPGPAEELSRKGVFSGGIFLGLAALTIPVTLLTIVFLAAWVFYWAGHSRLLLASLVLFGAALAIAPWTARHFVVHGKLVAIQANVDRHLPQIASKGDQSDDRLKGIMQRPDRFAMHFGKQFLNFWELYPERIQMSRPGHRANWNRRDSRVVTSTLYNPNRLIYVISIMSTGPVFFFAVVGTGAMWFRPELRRQLSLLWIMILSFAVGYAFFVGRIRYRIPVEPYIIILSAYGLVSVWYALRTYLPDFRSNKASEPVVN